MNEKKMSPQQRYALNQANAYQQQMQVMVSQRQQLELQLKEIEVALEELDKEEAKEVYKAIGPALIKKSKDDVVEDLKEAREKLEGRVKTFKSREKKLMEKLKELGSQMEG